MYTILSKLFQLMNVRCIIQLAGGERGGTENFRNLLFYSDLVLLIQEITLLSAPSVSGKIIYQGCPVSKQTLTY